MIELLNSKSWWPYGARGGVILVGKGDNHHSKGRGMGGVTLTYQYIVNIKLTSSFHGTLKVMTFPNADPRTLE